MKNHISTYLPTRSIQKSFIIAISGLLLCGCVSKAVYDEKQEGLTACQSSLQQCGDRLQNMTDIAAELHTQEIELRKMLRKEILAQDIVIERLKDRLSVRMLDRVLFDTGSTLILSRGESVLNKIGSSIKDKDYLIRVEGHTDNLPVSDELKSKFFSNWELSCARAASVVRYLEHGIKIDPRRLEAVGYSKYRPIVANDTKQKRQINRRVEIVITGMNVL